MLPMNLANTQNSTLSSGRTGRNFRQQLWCGDKMQFPQIRMSTYDGTKGRKIRQVVKKLSFHLGEKKNYALPWQETVTAEYVHCSSGEFAALSASRNVLNSCQAAHHGGNGSEA